MYLQKPKTARWVWNLPGTFKLAKCEWILPGMYQARYSKNSYTSNASLPTVCVMISLI